MKRLAILIIASAALGIAPIFISVALSAALEGEADSAPGPPSSQESFPVGEVTRQVKCAADPERSYALYLPSDYSPERAWPILILMDPRGRADLPMKLFREAAERHGYIIVSSYDTRSDSPQPVNRIAMRAILPDIEARFSLDLHRLYMAGFSGTARAAWGFGSVLSGRIAGVIGVGAGHPPTYDLIGSMPFAYFGTAGTGDFNYDEMRALDKALDSLDTPHRFEYFDGGHQWPNASVCGRAIAWMELQAIRSGLRSRDDTLIEELYEEMMEEATRLEEVGSQYEASVLFMAITTDFSGLIDISDATAKADDLGQLDAVRATQERHAEIAREHAAYQNRMMSFLAGLSGTGQPPPLSRSLRTLQIKNLQRRMEESDDPVGAAAARRWLEHAYVLTSYYVPRDRLDTNEPKFSLAALQIAAAIKPKNARICLGEARAYAHMGKTRKALRSLECALESGRIAPAQLDADPYLEPLHDEDGYRELLHDPGPDPD